MIFVDTGACVAFSVPGDWNGTAAKRVQGEIARGVRGPPVTTSLVLDEAAALIRMETDAAASRLLRATLEARSVTVVWIDEGHFRSATKVLEQHDDKRWSFTDCTSFVVMRELGILNAFSFDHNFEEAAFTLPT